MADSLCGLDHDEQRRELKAKAIQLLARREHGRKELSSKLPEADAGIVDQVLDQLELDGYLSDQRYASMLLRSRFSQGYGLQRVRADLIKKGVSLDWLELAEEEEQPDWFELAREQLHRKFRDGIADDFKQRNKQMRYLQGRGFSFDQIKYALSPTEE